MSTFTFDAKFSRLDWLPWLLAGLLVGMAAYAGWLCWVGQTALGRLGQ